MRVAKPKVDKSRLLELRGQGLTNQEIGVRLGLHFSTVGRHLRRLGHRGNGQRADSSRAKHALSYRKQLAAAGVRNLCQLAKETRGLPQRRALAERYNLPPDLYPVQVQILIALTGGPLTVAGLLAATGKSGRKDKVLIHGFNHYRVDGANYITALIRRGLVSRVAVCRGKGGGSGAAPGLYMLTPHAMDLLSGAKEKPHDDAQP